MALPLHKLPPEPNDLNFLTTLYHLSVKDIMEMDAPRLQGLVIKTEALGRWLKGIHELALSLNKKGD
ncbi:MAG: hypothetical protein KGQ54_04325 [Verrucomicrobia bacterium]|nr:hypothetical protein [Verrucomicrobiota bacterium]